jgi:hypothetical protein
MKQSVRTNKAAIIRYDAVQCLEDVINMTATYEKNRRTITIPHKKSISESYTEGRSLRKKTLLAGQTASS